MITVVTDRSLNRLSYQLMRQFDKLRGHSEAALNARTARKTIDLGVVASVLEKPSHRNLTLYNRQNNFAATLYETCWVLAGRNDIDDLSFFLPRAPDFADDGKTWRAGYGPRIRRLNYGGGELDQVERVIDTLTSDLSSRQAMMVIADPGVDLPMLGATKDFPCCNIVYFKMRDGKLDCEVIVRSNDVLWGYQAINVFEWTVLQELIANTLNVPLGGYLHYSSSLHLYSEHFVRLEAMLRRNDGRVTPLYDLYDYYPPVDMGVWSTFVRDNEKFLRGCTSRIADSETRPPLMTFESPFFTNAWCVIRSFIALRRASAAPLAGDKAADLCFSGIGYAGAAPDMSFVIPALEYAVRSIKNNKNITDTDRSWLFDQVKAKASVGMASKAYIFHSVNDG